MTIDVEEWFHTEWFNAKLIFDKYYEGKKPETDILSSVKKLLDLFDEVGGTTTFFILIETTERYPEVISEIYDKGHEVALHGLNHTSPAKLSDEQFENEIREAKSVLSKLCGTSPRGYRAPNFKITASKIDILDKLGFEYDSSVVPCLRIPGWYGSPKSPIYPYRTCGSYFPQRSENGIIEFPLAVMPMLRIPSSGGWYLRNLGKWWVKANIKLLSSKGHVVMYVHPWEVSDNNPKFNNVPFHVLRRAGKWTYQALKSLMKSCNAKNVPLCNVVEEM